MTERFHKDYINERTGVDLIVPNAKEQDDINYIIFEYLCQAKTSTSSFRMELERNLNNFAERECLDAIVLACTELINGICLENMYTSILDATNLHAKMATEIIADTKNTTYHSSIGYCYE